MVVVASSRQRQRSKRPLQPRRRESVVSYNSARAEMATEIKRLLFLCCCFGVVVVVIRCFVVPLLLPSLFVVVVVVVATALVGLLGVVVAALAGVVY
jgi:Flp pilus assembly protein TadB